MIDLNHLEKYTENNRIEAKKALGGLPHSIWETYSAFANTLGGIILLGVEEYKDKTLHTVDLPDPEALVREFWDAVNNPYKASVNLLTHKAIRIEKVNGDRIIVIEVPRAQRYDRPVFVDGNPAFGTYHRNGEGDCHCSEEEISAMYRDAAVNTQDMCILENTDCTVFSAESIRAYRQRMKLARPDHVWEKLGDEAFLLKLGAAGTGEDGTVHPTAAGLLMFGREQDICRRYPNYSLAYREEPDGISGQADCLVSSVGGWSGNVFDFYSLVSARLQQHLDAVTGTGSGIPAQDSPVRKALREGLANCLVNADYYGREGIEIICRRDLITMANPGDFRVELDEARSGGLSDPRNGILMKMFNLIDIGERAGSGIPSILYAWRMQGWSEPILTEQFDPNRIVLTLPLTKQGGRPAADKRSKKTAVVKTGDQKAVIVDYLTDHGKGTAAELADLLGVSSARVRKLIYALIAEGIVVSVGESRNRSYKLKA